jgi:hypothetical protein
LNRRKSNISPLVAARIRPTRRPPFGSAGDGSGGGLRISRSDKTADAPPPSLPDSNVSAELEEVRRTAESVRSADAALGRIHDLLMKLAGSLRPAREGRRRPPRASAILQHEIDTTLDAIDAIIQGTSGYDNRMLLASEWTPGATPRDGSASRGSGRVDGMPERSGKENPPRFLAVLRSKGAKSAGRAEPAEMLAIMEGHAAKIAAQRKHLEAFLNEKVLPLLRMLEIAEENVLANQSVLHDADFAASAGQVTGAEVLLNLCRADELNPGLATEVNPLAARLTIHHGDGE